MNHCMNISGTQESNNDYDQIDKTHHVALVCEWSATYAIIYHALIYHIVIVVDHFTAWCLLYWHIYHI